MNNVGMMSKSQLNSILSQLESMGASVSRRDIIISVTSPSGKPALSAALIQHRNSAMWHVRAVPGLISAV